MRAVFLFLFILFTSQISLAAIKTPSPEQEKQEANVPNQSFYGRKEQKRKMGPGLMIEDQDRVTPQSFTAGNRHDGEKYDESRLVRWRKWISGLHEELKNSNKPADQKMLSSLDRQVKDAEDLLNQLKSSGSENWENLHNQFNDLIARMMSDYEKAKKRK